MNTDSGSAGSVILRVTSEFTLPSPAASLPAATPAASAPATSLAGLGLGGLSGLGGYVTAGVKGALGGGGKRDRPTVCKSRGKRSSCWKGK